MAMVKICTKCKMVNQATDLECEGCGRDLTKIPAVDADKLNEEERKSEDAPAADNATMGDLNGVDSSEGCGGEGKLKSYRLCDCGHRNPTTVRKCEACGESLVGIEVTEETDSSGETATITSPPTEGPGTVINVAAQNNVVVRSLDGIFSFMLSCGSIVLGREAEGREYFVTKVFVGRRHAQFSLEDGTVYVEDLNSTNGTFINGVRIPQSTKIRVNEGDVVGLGGNDPAQQVQAAYLAFAKQV